MEEQDTEPPESVAPESLAEVSAIIEDNEEESTNTSGDVSVYEPENKLEEKSSESIDVSASTAVTPSDESKPDDVIEELKKHPLDDLPFEEVTTKVNNMKAETLHVITENDMFERYLTINDPAAIEGMATTIENAIKMQGAETVRRATLAENYSFSSDTKMEYPSIAASGLIDRGGPR